MDIVDSQSEVEEEYNVHPWRRYFARHIDASFIMLICMIVHGCFIQYFNQFMENALFISYAMISITIMCCNALILSLTGTTLGKFLFGVRIINKDNRRLKFHSALYREWLVVINLIFYIPIINFFALYKSYVRLTSLGITKWDEKLNCQILYRENNIKQKFFCIIGVILYIFLSLVVNAVQKIYFKML